MRFFNLIRNILAILGLLCLVAGGYITFSMAKSYGLAPRLLMIKALKKVGLESSYAARIIASPPLKQDALLLPDWNAQDWQGQGARVKRKLLPVQYDSAGNPIPSSWKNAKSFEIQLYENSRNVTVDNSKDFLSSIRKALPGDVITILPGKYSIKNRNIRVSPGGSYLQPITIRAEKLGDVFIELNSLEGFYIDSPYWVFENLDIEGTCSKDNYCEHAFHVVGNGRGFVLRNSRIHEFNSPIKANGIRSKDGSRIYPDGVLLENNSFYNSRARQTSNPVSFIDVVGVNHFIVSGNLIADFQKAQGDQISYAAQIKANSTDGVYENNLVIGEYQTSGGVRVGLSFGGGGTGRHSLLRHGDEQVEHTNGLVRNNIVMYCSDVGLYLNKAKDTKVINNTFYKTSGIDVRFPGSSAEVVNNLLSGKIRHRDGGTSILRNNLVRDADSRFLSFSKSFIDWFDDPSLGNFNLKNGKEIVDKGEQNDQVWEDFCGNPRGDRPDIGAIEYGKNKPCLPLVEIK